MKKTVHYLILILALQCCALAQAQWQNGLWVQKQAYNWYFGNQAGISFNTNPPTAITDSAIIPGLMSPQFGHDGATLIEGSGSISDANGNTLMYTNGQTVWNTNNQIMQNGIGLFGNVSSMQSGLIVPNPGNTGKYYVFTLSDESQPQLAGLFYSEVDINMDGGLGAVTGNKNIQLSTESEERISAVHHADGKQVWVVNNSHLSNEIQAFLVSDEGVSTTPVKSEVGVYLYASAIGEMKFSPDGTKIAITRPAWFGEFYIYVYNFDRTTGKATDLVAAINQEDIIGAEIYGCSALEFSPDSRFLYAGGLQNGTVYQFDLQAGPEQAIKDSGILIGTALLTAGWSMQLAPDGKIYITRADFNLIDYGPYVGTQSTLDVINYPNNPGLAAGYAENGIDLANGRNDVSIPVFIQSYLASGLLYEGDNCFGEEISFNTLRIAGITDIAWDFGDPASGANNSATGLNASHIFSAPGTYTVTAVITSNGALQTTTTQVTIGPEAILPSSDDLIKCADVSGNAIYNLTGLDTGILAGQDSDDYTVTYYTSAEDVTADNPVATPNAFTTSGQMIYAVVTNTVTGCKTTIQFDLVVNPLPLAGTPAAAEQCGNSSGTAVFDLTEQTALILNGQSPTEFNVVYYTDAAATNEIAQPEAFISSGQTIYAYVYNNATGCSAATQFNLILLPLPSLPTTTTFTGCSPFDLVAIAGEPDDTSSYSFFANEEDAINNSNAIADAGRYIVGGNTGSVYIRVKSNEGCIQVAELFLEAGDCFIPRGISPNNDSMNDVFDLSGFGVDQIYIFNRYGQQVYSKSNYMAEWHGQADNDKELPTGTYYYMIKLSTGESRTGWVYVNRED